MNNQLHFIVPYTIFNTPAFISRVDDLNTDFDFVRDEAASFAMLARVWDARKRSLYDICEVSDDFESGDGSELRPGM